MIDITPKAAAQVKKIMKDENMPEGFALRVGIKGGGCSGLSYFLNFDNDEKPGDKIFEENGIKLIVDSKSFLYLSGTELDFSDGLNGTGFQFRNPNAERTCGCGSSFGV
ncbi:iron-sulfur cluster insertion protein ErpA [bacterium]|nr:iron-sulfur cluster insertion protein ErpA [bacterium]